MLNTLVAIALGGALGALSRFALAQIPFLSRGPFPWMTLAANFLGAILIGFIVGLALTRPLSPPASAFLKTGFCGALTTFSTFSLETFSMLEAGRHLLALTYLCSSVILCLAGVFLGRTCAIRLFA